VSGSSIRCEVGGPSPEAHRELKISPAEFDEVAAELGRTLDFFKVPERETSVLSWPSTALSVISRRALVKASSFWKTTSVFRVTVSPVTGAGHGRAGSVAAQPFSISSA